MVLDTVPVYIHAGARFFCTSFVPCADTHDLCPTRSCKKQGSAPTDPHLYTKAWLYIAGAEVGKRARWLLASLSLKTTRMAVKRTLSCTDVFYTSAETLWTAANINKWHTGFFFLCIGGLQTKSLHPATYCIELCTTYASGSWHGTTLLMRKLTSGVEGRGKQLCPGVVQNRRAYENTPGWPPGWLQPYSYWCIKSPVVSLWHYLDSILAKTLNLLIFQEKDALQFQTVWDLVN